jgi:AcrR family transcriptional regulator
MSARRTRAEQSARNQARVLAAARRVFLAHGYHGATVERIADAAGFSTGVVYSQFRGKADLFLTLLEQRIEERARENAALVEGLSGHDALAALVDHVVGVTRRDAGWGLLVIEFRVNASRDPVLGRRYAAAHARTHAALAEVLGELYARAGEPAPLPLAELAAVVLALGAGAQLEDAAGALGGPVAASALRGLLLGAGTLAGSGA